MPIRNTVYYASVMKVYDGAIAAHIPVLQKQVCEIGVPLLVWFVRMEALLQFVPE